MKSEPDTVLSKYSLLILGTIHFMNNTNQINSRFSTQEFLSNCAKKTINNIRSFPAKVASFKN